MDGVSLTAQTPLVQPDQRGAPRGLALQGALPRPTLHSQLCSLPAGWPWGSRSLSRVMVLICKQVRDSRHNIEGCEPQGCVPWLSRVAVP